MKQQVLLSLDYELFFGSQTGSVENCLIRPTNTLAEIAQQHKVFLSLFIDALYLQRLSEEANRHHCLQRDYDEIRQQIVSLKEAGHDIQLHLHPHWIDSSYDGNHWQLNTTRYKLHDFSPTEIGKLVACGKKVLTDLVGDTVFAFRAGGWCLQPFKQIAPALRENDIWLDSTVFPRGISDDQDRWFDFSSAPLKDFWQFTIDPNKEEQVGTFVELPISAMRMTPSIFWRMALNRKFMSKASHKPYGEGSSLPYGTRYYFKRLTRSTISVASIDGLKAGLLGKAFLHNQSMGKQLFHAMGHPKAVTDYSLKQLRMFLLASGPLTGVTFQDFKHLQTGTNGRLPNSKHNSEKDICR